MYFCASGYLASVCYVCLSVLCFLVFLRCCLFCCIFCLFLLNSYSYFLYFLSIPFFPSLSAACCSSLTCIRFLRPSFLALSSFRFSLFRSFSCFCLPMLRWSVSVLVVEGRIGQCVCRLVVFAVDVPYFPLHPFVCQLFS